MPFIVKATYRHETRKISFADSHFPRFDELYQQLYRVYRIGQSYYLSKLLFSPGGTGRILIGVEAHSVEEYNVHCAPFLGRFYPNGVLAFSVFDETPHKAPQATLPGSYSHPGPPAPFFTPPPPPSQPMQMEGIEQDATSTTRNNNSVSDTQATTKTSTACCSVSEGRQEVKSMIDTFMQDLQRVLGSTFPIEERSFFDPLDTPTMKQRPIPRTPSPLPPISLDASLHIPGSFMEPPPQMPKGMDVENNQSPPKLEPSQMLHPGIWCDFCGKQIRGLRFNCQECPDYDLCSNCIVVNQALDKHNADKVNTHRFDTYNPPIQKDVKLKEIVTPLGPRVNTPPTVIHENVVCNECNQTIVGARFKCLNCLDFDLCGQCVLLCFPNSSHKAHHFFLKLSTPTEVGFHTTPVPATNPTSTTTSMPVPEANPTSTSTSTPPDQATTPAARSYRHPSVHNARCDLCDTRISGARYKCTDCPDFDTCSDCFAITTDQHPGHTFVRLTKPNDLMLRSRPTQASHLATCNGCHSPIVGVRYKCMHPNCPDYDLCQNCEAFPISIHPDTHPFLKIKNGDAPIPLIQQNEPAHEAKVTTTAATEMATQPQAVDPAKPAQASKAVSTSDVEDVIERSTTSSLSSSSPIERLHAIRDQAARRLNRRMQHLQSYPFAEGKVSGLDIDPLIQERLVREREEAEEKARALDQEILELENARRRKHDEALKQSSRHFLETLKVVFANEPDTYHAILVLLKECVNAKDQASLAASKGQLRELFDGRSNVLKGSLEAFLVHEVNGVLVESHPKPEKPASPKPVTADDTLRRLSLLKAEKEQEPAIPYNPAAVAAKMKDHDVAYPKLEKPEGPDPVVTEDTLRRLSMLKVHEEQEECQLGVPYDFAAAAAKEEEHVEISQKLSTSSTLPSKPAHPNPLITEEDFDRFLRPYIKARDEQDEQQLAVPYDPAAVAAEGGDHVEMSQESTTTSSTRSMFLRSSLNASFVSDNNIPDGHVFPAGAEFVKSWRVKNTSTRTWDEGTQLVFVGGDRLGSSGNAPLTYVVPHAARPGEQIDVSTKDMKAPEIPGRYISHWRLRDAQGLYFGPRMWCDILVAEARSRSFGLQQSEIDSDSARHDSLVSSEVIMPEIAPEQPQTHAVETAADATPAPSSPVTAPSSIATLTDDASSDVSSIRSASAIDHADSDWDEIPDAPQVTQRQMTSAASASRTDNVEEGYQVLYDSASDEA